MTPAAAETPDGNKPQASRSLRATWRAIRQLPGEPFPRLLPGVHAIAAPIILWHLKRNGYSHCRVVVQDRGLMVYADR